MKMKETAHKRAVAPGYQIGKLTVEAATEERRGGYTVWRCRCGCGGSVLLDTRYLQRGTITDCGCESRVKPRIRDLTGQRFGKLTALRALDERTKNGGVVWLCRCDCGGEVRVPSRQLTGGCTKSCGCLSRPPLKDYIGRRFGRLTVTAYAGKQEGQHMWRCVCECGRETEVRQTNLQTGKTQSCGCYNVAQVRESLGLTEGTAVRILEYYKTHLSGRNASGCNGVYQNKRTRRWVAQITFCGKTRYLGNYENKEDAVKARRRAEEHIEAFLEQYYAEHPEWVRARQDRAV